LCCIHENFFENFGIIQTVDFLFLEILRQVFPAAAMNSVEIRAVKNITYCIPILIPHLKSTFPQAPCL